MKRPTYAAAPYVLTGQIAEVEQWTPVVDDDGPVMDRSVIDVRTVEIDCAAGTRRPIRWTRPPPAS